MKLLAAFLTQSVFSNNEDPTRIHVDEGGTVTLPCSIEDSFLSPVVEWRHSGQRVAKRLEERVKLVKSSPLVDRVKVSLVPGSADLSLSNASASDEGSYECEIYSAITGEVVALTTLNLEVLGNESSGDSDPLDNLMIVEGSGIIVESSGSSVSEIEDQIEESIQEISGDSFLTSDDGLVILEDELESNAPLEDRAEEAQPPCSTVCQSNEIFYNGECLTVDLCSVLGVCAEDSTIESTCQNNKDGPPTCLPYDPCSDNPCDQIKGSECIAKGSSYSCVCEDGAMSENGSCERNPCSDLSCQSCESCYNFETGARCVKKSGFDHSSAKCSDIDECALGYDRCDVNAECVNLIGNYWCQCHAGYAKNKGICEDVDECADVNNCDQICENNIGSYSCSCQPGYSLQVDGHSCEDIDECAAGICGDNSICENTAGSYTCECDEFYEEDKNEKLFHCIDIDECALEEPFCGEYSDCLNNIGFEPTCTCHSGYSSEDGKNCQDIDECEVVGTCMGRHENCENTIGSFKCVCDFGYEYDDLGNCAEIDECLLPENQCVGSQICVDHVGFSECVCPVGFTVEENGCDDINECDQSPCAEHETCNNIPGSFKCSCDHGFEKSCDDATEEEGSGSCPCLDINECAREGPKICIRRLGPNSQCVNSDGDFGCECKDGFELIDGKCKDINECADDDDNNCSENANCSNEKGGFTCNCRDGYKGDGVNCEDIDECANENNCHAKASCDNEDGSYRCTCEDGYTGDGFMCEDIDECTEEDACGTNEVCINIIGSFRCRCPEGFDYNDLDDCVDVDECALKDDDCRDHSACVNTNGGFECPCLAGFADEDNDSCVNINECLTDPCPQNGHCEDTEGSFICECNSGFTEGDNESCVDVDECLADPCNMFAVCKNTIGSYSCDCSSGFRRAADGMCEDVDECATSPCHTHATCENRMGSFICLCDSGFEGDGKNCSDINECEFTDCGVNTDCVNTIGSFACSCLAGFEIGEDGCENIDECARSPCQANEVCVDSEGSFECNCADGFLRHDDEEECQDIDECEENPCSENSVCRNFDGGFTCTCIDGYSSAEDGNLCLDTDECSDKNVCGKKPNSFCVNNDGGFFCDCNFGFIDHLGTCVDDNECLKNTTCHENAECTNSIGRFECECKEGFEGDGFTCSDIDECAVGLCGEFVECRNSAGSYECYCLDGFSLSNDQQSCEDVNECIGDDDPCGENQVCENAVGTFFCECESGYESVSENSCIDLDECTGQNQCHEHAVCLNTDGDYECECKSGFKGDGVVCSDIKECATSPCGDNEICLEELGGFKCECQTGFFRADDGTCIDFPECDQKITQNGKTICAGAHQTCSETEGSFECGCEESFRMENGKCVDIDECKDNVCPEICVNFVGGYRCECNIGFGVIHNNECADIDECLADTESSLCQENSVCVNGIGSYECECVNGYQKDENGFCNNINECEQDKDECSQKCVDTVGSYICACAEGFTLANDGKTCVDIDECADRGYCGESECRNSVGSYECYCTDGFRLNAGSCEDINECASSPCHENAECKNYDGHHTCTCAEGFIGDGYSCDQAAETMERGEQPEFGPGVICEDNTSSSSSSSVSCPHGWSPIGEECFLYVNKQHTYERAKSVCNRYGAKLIQGCKIYSTVVDRLRLKNEIWIGLERENGNWSWSDGSVSNDVRWAQPRSLSHDDGERDCGALVMHNAIINMHCEFTFSYICQAPAIECTLPTEDTWPVGAVARTANKHAFALKESVTFECPEGTVLVGDSSAITCEANGQFSPISFSCVKACDQLPSVADAKPLLSLSEDFGVGSKVTYSCVNFNIKPVGIPTITCQEDGTWTKADFSCSSVCHRHNDVQNAHQYQRIGKSEIALDSSVDRFKAGDVVVFRCDEGFKMKNPDRPFTATCEKSGFWSNKNVKACMRGCHAFEVPDVPNSRMFGKGKNHKSKNNRLHRIGEKIHFLCKKGFFALSPRGAPEQPPTLQCTKNGWQHMHKSECFRNTRKQKGRRNGRNG